jgi:hypothetical protein
MMSGGFLNSGSGVTQIATALDDNLHVPVPLLVQFELALVADPADRTTRLIYRDWLLKHG